MTETQIIRLIMNYFDEKDVYAVRLNSGSVVASYAGKKRLIKLCPPGTPDIMFIIAGRAFFLEVKRDQPERTKWLKKIDEYKKTNYAKSYNFRELSQWRTKRAIEKAGSMVFLVIDLDEVAMVYDSIIYATQDKLNKEITNNEISN